MPSQSTRILVLLCVVMGLMWSSGLAPGYAAEDREILEHIAGQTHHDERLERIFPAHFGERRAICEGYLNSCPIM